MGSSSVVERLPLEENVGGSNPPFPAMISEEIQEQIKVISDYMNQSIGITYDRWDELHPWKVFNLYKDGSGKATGHGTSPKYAWECFLQNHSETIMREHALAVTRIGKTDRAVEILKKNFG